VPTLFHPWAEALVGRLAPSRGIRALDAATGPGTVARILSRVIGRRGQIVASDSSPSMIARAESKPAVDRGAAIAYTVAPAAPLPFPDHSFDLVTCQQGLQFFPDAGAALTEMRRVLVPNGRLGASVWCPREECSVFYGMQEAMFAAGQSKLAELLSIPFPRWTDEDLAARARELGFGSIRVFAETREVVFEGGVDQVFQAMFGTPIAPLLSALSQQERAAILEAAHRTLAPLIEGGAVRGPMRSWILLATA
jgi:ubiquinone/menaquinone biosynthesis C-methylase UbiE